VGRRCCRRSGQTGSWCSEWSQKYIVGLQQVQDGLIELSHVLPAYTSRVEMVFSHRNSHSRISILSVRVEGVGRSVDHWNRRRKGNRSGLDALILI
jgi:hypothetical protein